MSDAAQKPGVSRRRMVAGAAAGAAALTVGGTASAAPTQADHPEDRLGRVVGSGRATPSATNPDYRYLFLSLADFTPRSTTSNRIYESVGNFSDDAGSRMVAPLHLPAGSIIKDIEIYCLPSAATMDASVTTYDSSSDSTASPIQTTIPTSATAVAHKQTGSYLMKPHLEGAVLLLNMANATNTCRGVRVGYLPAPAGQITFIDIERLADTRSEGPVTTRVAELDVSSLVPENATAVLVQISVKVAQGQGNISVYAADKDFTGTPAALWSKPGIELTELATPAFTQLSSDKKFKVRLKAVKPSNATANYIVDLLAYVI